MANYLTAAAWMSIARIPWVTQKPTYCEAQALMPLGPMHHFKEKGKLLFLIFRRPITKVSHLDRFISAKAVITICSVKKLR